MNPRAFVIGAVLLALVGPTAVGDTSSAAYAPAAVITGSVQGALQTVAWTVGSEPADYYNVYGATSNGALTLLADHVTAPVAAVPAGFAAYGVAGVRQNVESVLVFPLENACIVISWDPPGVDIADC